MKSAMYSVIVTFLAAYLVFVLDGQAQPLPPDSGSFSLVVLSDTQGYQGNGTKKTPHSDEQISNPVFDSQVNWIVANQETQNIVLVIHSGDLVDVNNALQWQLARQNMDVIHGKIPYGMSVGNHDMEEVSGNSALYQAAFPASRYAAFPWYGGSYANNTNSFQLVSAQGVDLLVLNLECNAPDAALAWADSVLVAHRDRLAIINTHMFLGPREQPENPDDYFSGAKGVMRWSKCHGNQGNTAQEIWDKCLRKHANVRIIQSGDQSRSNALHQQLTGDSGNTVHALLCDYSQHPGGAIRIYRFFPDRGKVEALTYSTVDGRLVVSTRFVPEEAQHHFEMDVAFNLYHENQQ